MKRSAATPRSRCPAARRRARRAAAHGGGGPPPPRARDRQTPRLSRRRRGAAPSAWPPPAPSAAAAAAAAASVLLGRVSAAVEERQERERAPRASPPCFADRADRDAWGWGPDLRCCACVCPARARNARGERGTLVRRGEAPARSALLAPPPRRRRDGQYHRTVPLASLAHSRHLRRPRPRKPSSTTHTQENGRRRLHHQGGCPEDCLHEAGRLPPAAGPAQPGASAATAAARGRPWPPRPAAHGRPSTARARRLPPHRRRRRLSGPAARRDGSVGHSWQHRAAGAANAGPRRAPNSLAAAATTTRTRATAPMPSPSSTPRSPTRSSTSTYSWATTVRPLALSASLCVPRALPLAPQQLPASPPRSRARPLPPAPVRFPRRRRRQAGPRGDGAQGGRGAPHR